MQLLLVVCLALAATNTPSATTAGKSWTGRLVTKTPSLVTWLIDGTNLACSRHVPGDREALVERLQEIASPIGTSAADDDGTTIVTNVVLVFDGDEDEVFSKSTFGWFQQIVTDGKGKVKDRADDHIVQHVLPELQQLNGRVHLVSADKELGKRVQASGVMKGGSMVHPPKFWKEYLPNLQQRRQVQAQQRKKSM
ncbi:expressed unknown protein [Seminavis robusta]|uniref:Uncharacterized protein n=1 Tax=Seminavis robusta TaxID=568900 RepID=A0A9N8EGX0_9STRA|nr:expressed unknown protein [Seminavis robusta]|eukprot:Sro1184_g250160.1 n/a (195) ;mRNA; f:24675-25259